MASLLRIVTGRYERLRVLRVARFAGASEDDATRWLRDWKRECPGDVGADLELYLIVRGTMPGRIVETGVNRGRSTAAMLRALLDNGNGGTLTSIDLPTNDPWGRLNASGERDRAWVPEGMTGCEIPEYLRADGRWRLILGDARVELPKLEPGYDFFFHDSDHSLEHQRFEYGAALNALAPDGVLASDDIRWRAPPHAWDVLGFSRRTSCIEWPPAEPFRGAVRLR